VEIAPELIHMLRVGRNGDCCLRLNTAAGVFAAVTEGGNLQVQWETAPQQFGGSQPRDEFQYSGMSENVSAECESSDDGGEPPGVIIPESGCPNLRRTSGFH